MDKLTYEDLVELMESVDGSAIDAMVYCVDCFEPLSAGDEHFEACFLHVGEFCHCRFPLAVVTIDGRQVCRDCDRERCPEGRECRVSKARESRRMPI